MKKNGGGHMKNAYLSRQVFFAFNQFAIICYLGFMAAQNDFIQQNSFVHFLLLSFLIFDAEYISYKNVKGNKTLNHFSLSVSIVLYFNIVLNRHNSGRYLEATLYFSLLLG